MRGRMLNVPCSATAGQRHWMMGTFRPCRPFVCTAANVKCYTHPNGILASRIAHHLSATAERSSSRAVHRFRCTSNLGTQLLILKKTEGVLAVMEWAGKAPPPLQQLWLTLVCTERSLSFYHLVRAARLVFDNWKYSQLGNNTTR
jgi:hypothetical protein